MPSRPALLAVALLLAAAPASGSFFESLTGLTYQNDADEMRDAPDTCAGLAAYPDRFVVPLDNQTHGTVILREDPLDHYRVIVAGTGVGGRYEVRVLPSDASPKVAIDVHMPGCGTSVAAPENQPTPPPSPPPPGPGEKQVSPHNLPEPGGNGNCEPTKWRFRMTQIATPPSTIYVVWTNGARANVSLASTESNNVAYYDTTQNLAYSLEHVSANVPQSWSGTFNVNKRPCNTVHGGAVFGEPNTVVGTVANFTATQAGTYVLRVEALDPEVPTRMPVNCHTACNSALPLVSYATSYTRK